jgi:hypothetical protein
LRAKKIAHSDRDFVGVIEVTQDNNGSPVSEVAYSSSYALFLFD